MSNPYIWILVNRRYKNENVYIIIMLGKFNILRFFKDDDKEYDNRFLKFYHINKKRLNKERRSKYQIHKEKGLCVRCSKPSIEGIVFCDYHQSKQKGYNAKARAKN